MFAIASDHGGFVMKAQIIAHLQSRGIEIADLGCYSEDSVDYPEYAAKLCKAIRAGEYERGILVCGTGIGMSIAANKFSGIRATLCGDCFSAEMSRQHNNSNVLCLGGRVLGQELALRITDIWIDTPFSGLEKHERRLGMIAGLEG